MTEKRTRQRKITGYLLGYSIIPLVTINRSGIITVTNLMDKLWSHLRKYNLLNKQVEINKIKHFT